MILGLILAFGVGAFCQFFKVPLPAPTVLFGAFIVMAMTGGFSFVDWWLKRGAKK